MDQQAAAADGITEALALMAFVDPEPGQQGTGLDAHTRDALGVVRHNGGLVALSNYKHKGGAGAVGLPGELHKPGVLLLGAAAAHAWG